MQPPITSRPSSLHRTTQSCSADWTQSHFSAVPPSSWATFTNSDAENTQCNENRFLSPGHGKEQSQGFQIPFHLIFWITNTSDFPSHCLSFLPSSQEAQHSPNSTDVHPKGHLTAAKLLGLPSLFIFADELRLCN